MDPVSALAFTCNILDLVGKGVKCSKTILALYKDGSTGDQDDFSSMADTIGAVVTELQQAPTTANVRQSALDPEIAKMLAKSTRLCSDLQRIIKKCKPHTTGSLKETGIALFQKLVHKSDVEALVSDLDTCRMSLFALLSTATAQNVINIQAELHEAGLNSGRTTAKIQQLDDLLRKGTADVQSQLDSLLTAFREARDEIIIRRILKALEFFDMDARFISVHDAERDTFDWIFDDPESLLAKEPGLAMSFTDWLQSGSGIFHIVGKPGFGKSTLMKYLCGHQETFESLDKWALSRGTELIFCKFFFWRVTPVAEQKTLKGLIRGLLYSVISQVPALSKRLFREQWSAPGKTNRVPQLDDRQFSDAFEKLVNDDEIVNEFSFCFFIDGLDEFEASISLQPETHYALANKLLKWAVDSNGRVKMCVSSRHFPEFTLEFPSSQRLTLQSLTERDIRTLVLGRLESNERFVQLREQSRDHRIRCKNLVHTIQRSAEGVFLWVVLVLNELERALVTSDALELLERIVATAPMEIKDLVHSILLSIPEIHKQGAHYLLAVIMMMQGIFTSRAQASKLVQATVDAANAKYGINQSYYIYLRECAMLFDAADCGRLLDCPIDFAVVSCDPQNDSAARSKEANRLAERCRGLVEPDLWLKIRFTHRAIPEALQDFFFQDKSERYVEDIRVAEVLAWILLGDIRLHGRPKLNPCNTIRGNCTGEESLVDWTDEESSAVSTDNRRLPNSTRKGYSIQRLRYVALTRLRMYPGQPNGSGLMNNLLYHITEAILYAQYNTLTPDDQTWSGAHWHQTFDGEPLNFIESQLPLGVFDNFQLHEFTVWFITNKLKWESDRHRLLAYLCEIIITSDSKLVRHRRVSSPDFVFLSSAASKCLLDALQQRGVTLADGQQDTRRVWHDFVCRELHYGRMDYCYYGRRYRGVLQPTQVNWKGIERLLRFGADPEVFLSRNKTHRLLLGPSQETLFAVKEGEWGRYGSKEPLEGIPEWPSAVSLTALIKLHEPPNMVQLLKLIAENNDKLGRPTTDASKWVSNVASEPRVDASGSVEEVVSQQAQIELVHRTAF